MRWSLETFGSGMRATSMVEREREKSCARSLEVIMATGTEETVNQALRTKEAVKARYGSYAEVGGGREEAEACCGQDEPVEATCGFAVGEGMYGDAEMSVVPDGALGLSRGCGNPTGFADLQSGEVVVDFGCGAGMDVILAAQQVGPTGRVFGIDFADQMIERGEENAAKAGVAESVEFRVEDVTKTQLSDHSADVVISNCVINLCPDKPAAYREAFRVLRPGGRVAISDVVFIKPIPPELEQRFRSMSAGVLAWAMPEADYMDMVHQTGFTDVHVVACHPLGAGEVDAMAHCPGKEFSPAVDPADLETVQGNLASVKFTASKPQATEDDLTGEPQAIHDQTVDIAVMEGVQEILDSSRQVEELLASAQRAARTEAKNLLVSMQAPEEKLAEATLRAEDLRALLAKAQQPFDAANMWASQILQHSQAPEVKAPTETQQIREFEEVQTAAAQPGVIVERDVKEVVKGRYGAAAEQGGGEDAVCCPGETPASPSFAAEHGLYSQEELSLVPETAFSLSRGCGNPTGFADLQPGEVVVDFGCGAGIDVVLAAHKVGPTGKVVGADFTPQMIERAKQAVAEANVSDTTEFVVTDLERVELPDSVADVVISNCVINLCPDKAAVYREAFRILKPGGRLAISDIVYAGEIAPEVHQRFQSTWAGCVGGAIQEDHYFQIVQDAGFTTVEEVARHALPSKELEEMASCPGPNFTPAPAKDDIASAEGKVVSIKYTALKPQPPGTEENLYSCEMCGAEVKIVKKTVEDPNCPTLLCCGKPMKAKETPAL